MDKNQITQKEGPFLLCVWLDLWLPQQLGQLTYEGRIQAPSPVTSHTSDTSRLPNLPLHSERDLMMLALKTDFENRDLALVQLEKSHIAGTFCTDVKSA